jgi:hypothetical protein
MATKMADNWVGSWSPTLGWQLSKSSYACLTESKDPITRRVRPKGTEMLFNGTNMGCSRYRAVRGTYVKYSYYYQDGRPISGVQQTVPENIQAVSASFGLTYSVSEWANELRLALIDMSSNMAVNLVEYKQAAQMFVDFSGRLIKAYTALKRGRPHDVYRALSGGKPLPKGWKRGFPLDVRKTMSDNWLAWQYGVKPMASDLAGALDEYYKARSTKPLIRRVTLRLPKKSAHGFQVQPIDELKAETIITLGGRLLCYAEFEDGATGFDSIAQRLGFTNPALLLWEVIPYSFVIDWFMNVGEFLAAAETPKGLKRVGIHVTSRYSQVNNCTQHGGWSASHQTYTRRLFYSSLPAPVLNFPIQHSIASWQRIASGLALIRSPGSAYGYPSRR